jgi:hypothetical protein
LGTQWVYGTVWQWHGFCACQTCMCRLSTVPVVDRLSKFERYQVHAITPGFKAKLNAHSICAQESSFHTYRTENEYRTTNDTNIVYLLHK